MTFTEQARRLFLEQLKEISGSQGLRYPQIVGALKAAALISDDDEMRAALEAATEESSGGGA
ncbi:MAG: hypothetical protein A2Z40_03320 [Deltaproteobacteria bacterium RBG_19FT_COMBO_60_16]|nr:MAG: hypothetical protein A2Z40_03320 [Deltaproteobacteria bacterium RBG_19FT_COMBO_60_16]